MFRTLRSQSSRSRLLAAPLFGAAVLALLTSRPASALNWTNVSCVAAPECPQVGTPVGFCACGLYKDAPGVATTARKDAAFVFAKNAIVNFDETAMWKAPLTVSLQNQVTLEVRGAVNDNSDLKVVLYDTLGADYNTCASQGMDVVGFLDWNDEEDDSMFRQKTAVITPNVKVAGICLIITENPEGANPASQRSSAIVDYIALISTGGVKTFVEDFALNF